jgi:hypothetical protein
MVVTREHIELLYNFPINFPWKKETGNLFASDFFLLKKEICRIDISIFPDVPDPLGRLKNIQLPISEEHITEEPQLPTGDLAEHLTSPENANTVEDHHSDPPNIARKRSANNVKQVTFLNEEKDPDTTTNNQTRNSN